jgi:putative PEP-CTERM system histidine kinase
MDWSLIIAFAAGLTALGVAVAVAVSPRSPAQRLFVAGMLLLSADSLAVTFSHIAVLPQDAAFWLLCRLFIVSLTPGVWLAFSIAYARENSRALLKQTRWLWLAALAVPAAAALLFRDELLSTVVESVPGAPWTVELGKAGLLLNLWMLIGGILVLMHLERTYRAAVGTMRWRIKFMVLGVGSIFVLRAFTASQVIIFGAANPSLQSVESLGLLIACAVICRALVRPGHFDVDVYAARSLLHSSLTILLAGIYLVVLGSAAKLTQRFGADSAFQFRAFVTLLALFFLSVLLLSDRARLWTRRFISRHLHRPLYDYRAVWRTFTESTARCVGQKELSDSIARVVCDVFQALSVSLWLADELKLRLSLETSTSLSSAGDRVISGTEAAAVIHSLSGKEEPVDIDVSRDPWAAVLRRANPGQFAGGGNRICVPIAAGKEFLGCMIVADRVGGVPYTTEDFELLKALGDQSAASLLNVQLSQKLAQAGQLQAFQAMSAFFVHDLKNTASTLALMLKNFPVHYHNVAFREDALRGISKTVTHINDLVERLNLLRHELDIRTADCDLNQLVTDTLRNHEAAEGIEFIKELRPIPALKADPAQLQKVVTNLLLNAREAVGNQGRITVETSRSNGWIVLGVADTGCGMSGEFINRSLFRPFQSTKKDGLGIGMFHCKMIVEAHRGKIEVESEVGKGTAFRVFLPVPA